MPTSRRRCAWIAFWLTGFALPAYGADDAPILGTLVTAKVIERELPEYPSNAQSGRREGWVLVSFCIDVRGSLHTPVIERSSGSPDFERAVLKKLPTWKYEPARLNGEPVEQCRAQVRFSFSMEDAELGAGIGFVRAFKKALSLIAKGESFEAKALLEGLTPRNNYESARIALARAQIAASTGDSRARLDALRMALHFQSSIEPRLLQTTRRQVFALEVQQREWAAAIDTYQDLADQVDELTESETHAAEQLAVLATGAKTLATDGELECRCDKANGEPLWSARLLRREFGFGDASGKLERFELRCQTHRFAAAFVTETTWKVPESWGSCRLYMFGEEGAKFRLHELPASIAEGP